MALEKDRHAGWTRSMEEEDSDEQVISTWVMTYIRGLADIFISKLEESVKFGMVLGLDIVFCVDACQWMR